MKFLGFTKIDNNRTLHLITALPNKELQYYQYDIYSQKLSQNGNLILIGKIFAINNNNFYKIEII